LRGRQAVRARQVVVDAGSVQRLGPAPALLLHRGVGQAGALGRTRARGATGVVLAGQKADAQRRIGQQAHVQAVAAFVHAVFPAAVDQAVRVLHAGHARQAVLLGQAHELVNAIRRLVGQADGTHLARLDQLSHGFQLLVDGSTGLVLGRIEIHGAKRRQVACRPVNLVQIDHVRLQAAQAAVAGGQDFGFGQASLIATDPRHAA